MDASFASGKGHRDENFPVASWLLKRAHRAPILAFYRFARAADDIADHAGATPESKLAALGAMRHGLDGVADGAPEALALHAVLRDRALSDDHARDLLQAFEQDVTVYRYPDWDALLAYCRLSAAPVGRFVLDVHGEDLATWPASDALCAALQIVNHLQDCGKDWRALGRSYIPHSLLPEPRQVDLAASASSPELLVAIRRMATRTLELLATAKPFAAQIVDRRLAAEVRVIHRLAHDLATRLLTRDPLADKVHHSKLEAARLALGAVLAR